MTLGSISHLWLRGFEEQSRVRGEGTRHRQAERRGRGVAFDVHLEYTAVGRTGVITGSSFPWVWNTGTCLFCTRGLSVPDHRCWTVHCATSNLNINHVGVSYKMSSDEYRKQCYGLADLSNVQEIKKLSSVEHTIGPTALDMVKIRKFWPWNASLCLSVGQSPGLVRQNWE